MAAIQIVVGVAATPSASDLLIKSWLNAIGHIGDFVDDDTAENTAGYDGVVITDSCATGSLGTKYEAVAKPVFLHEGFYVDTMRMTSGGDALTETATQWSIVAPTHPFVNGPYGVFSGTWTWAGSAQAVAYIDSDLSSFGAGVTQIAVSLVDASQKVMFAYESGATMASGTAPAKRGYFSFRDTVGANLNADGINAIKNAYTWAFGNQGAVTAWLGA